MSPFLVILLGVLQGLTEFLPVSSSGHLRLLAHAFGVGDPQTLFDVLLHLGTLVAVVFVYREIFARMFRACWRVLTTDATFAREPDARLVILAGVAVVPTGVIGLLIGTRLEALSAQIAYVGAAFLLNGVILLVLGALSKRTEAGEGRTIEQLTLKDALIIGAVQGFAVTRGISRSGSTITAGLAVGLDREAAAAFSFIMSVPAIIAAVIFENASGDFSGGSFWLYALGATVAAVVGTLALTALLGLLRRGKLHHFAWYSFALGALAITLGLYA